MVGIHCDSVQKKRNKEKKGSLVDRREERMEETGWKQANWDFQSPDSNQQPKGRY